MPVSRILRQKSVQINDHLEVTQLHFSVMNVIIINLSDGGVYASNMVYMQPSIVISTKTIGNVINGS